MSSLSAKNHFILSCKSTVEGNLLCAVNSVCLVKPSCSPGALRLGTYWLSAFKYLLIEAALIYIKGQEPWYAIINK